MPETLSLYTIVAITENSSGVLHRLTAIFTRRKVNVESLCVSETNIEGLSRFTISVKVSEDLVRKMVAQIEKIIEVVSASYFMDDELYFREIAFFRIKASDIPTRTRVEQYASLHGCTIVFANKESIVLEKTGQENEISSIAVLLEPHGLVEFIRSGRIAISKKGSIF